MHACCMEDDMQHPLPVLALHSAFMQCPVTDTNDAQSSMKMERKIKIKIKITP